MDIDPYGWPEFVANPRHRCYLCKKQIYTLFQARAAEHGAALLDGTNHDDLGDDRPGLRALAELAVHTPLAEVGLTKAEIRHQARLLGLPNWDKPSASCLATRVMDGQPITVDRIRVVAQGEEFLAGLHFRGSRFRHHGRHCRLEVRAEDGWRLEQDDIWSKVHSFCRTMGFTTIKSGVRPGNGS